MNEAWRTIWEQRDAPGKIGLTDLMAADGFDVLASCSEEAWRAYARRVGEQLGLSKGDSVFEVGCGAGAFLLPFSERGHKVGGVDFSPNLVSIARSVMPSGHFETAAAHELPSGILADFVVSNGVFLYFSDLDYANLVLQAMVRAAQKGLAILEVADLATQQECLRARRGKLGDAEYARRYAGLDHLFFSREWFVDRLREAGLEPRIEDQAIDGYFHNRFRFNVFAKRTPHDERVQ